ncbi:TetR/AcrR family transcriptional regulator [Actinoplanes sp. NPDC049265]|uniref:TetR/AcrR family transcriptional regulator n=1 Tax=Actinoplanes sp. NPDC049265 TaxID=3363902 RepID=UPI003711FC63
MSTEGHMTYGTQRQAAARNRATILETAHELLAASPRASMNEIAKRAGVGAGTLYRHFPTRESLLLAVYRHDVDRIIAAVDDALSAGPAIDAFVAWFEQLAGYLRLKHGLGEAFYSATSPELISESSASITAAVGRLLDACAAEGSMRAGLDPYDILLLMGFLWRVGTEEEGRRLTALVLDGLRPR